MVEQRGIALFQVLLITAIVSVLLVIISANASYSVSKAQLSSDRLDAKLDTYSAWSDFQFRLLTESWFQGRLSTVPDANFYGSEFSFNNVQVKLRSQSSLLYIGTKGVLLRHLLQRRGVDESRAKLLVDTLSDWSDNDGQRRLLGAEAESYSSDGIPPNLPIQHIYELELIKGWDKALVNDIKPFITMQPNGILNPAFMPRELMTYYVSDGKADILEGLRQQDEFSIEKFSQITGIVEDEFLRLSPSSRLVLHLERTSKNNEFNTYMHAVFDVFPYESDPIVIRETEWR